MKPSHDQTESIGKETPNHAQQLQEHAYAIAQSRMANNAVHQMRNPAVLPVQHGAFTTHAPQMVNLTLPSGSLSSMPHHMMQTQSRGFPAMNPQLMNLGMSLQVQIPRPNFAVLHSSRAVLMNAHRSLQHQQQRHHHQYQNQQATRLPGGLQYTYSMHDHTAVQSANSVCDFTNPPHVGSLGGRGLMGPSSHTGSVHEALQSSSDGKDEPEPEPTRREYRDFALDPEANKPPLIPIRRSNKDQTFPVVLYAILSNRECKEYVSWMPHGRSFMVHNPDKVEEEVLPLYFQHTKLSSFMRQINGWGFRRIPNGPDQNSYYHEMFLRGFPNLCDKMRRPSQTSKSASGRRSYPNFYDTEAYLQLPGDDDADRTASNKRARDSSDSDHSCNGKTDGSGTGSDGQSSGGNGSGDRGATYQMTKDLYGMGNLYNSSSGGSDRGSSSARSNVYGSNNDSHNSSPHDSASSEQGCGSDNGSSGEGGSSDRTDCISGHSSTNTSDGCPSGSNSDKGAFPSGSNSENGDFASSSGSDNGEFPSLSGSENGEEDGTRSDRTTKDRSSL